IRLLLLLALVGAATPAPAQTASMAVAQEIIAAPPDPLGDIAAWRRAEEARCQSGESDAIIVCGRLVQGGGGYRVPYRPEPGTRVRLIAGEPPSAMAAMAAGGCLRLCERRVMINLLDPGSIVRGLDRVFRGQR